MLTLWRQRALSLPARVGATTHRTNHTLALEQLAKVERDGLSGQQGGQRRERRLCLLRLRQQRAQLVNAEQCRQQHKQGRLIVDITSAASPSCTWWPSSRTRFLVGQFCFDSQLTCSSGPHLQHLWSVGSLFGPARFVSCSGRHRADEALAPRCLHLEQQGAPLGCSGALFRNAAQHTCL
jgi:hypothetical protein